MSVNLKQWILNLISVCARKDQSNVFRHDQTMDKNVLLKNYDVDYSGPATSNNSGTTHSLIAVNQEDNPVGSLDFFRSTGDAYGMRFNVRNHALGFTVGDGEVVTSFVDHPRIGGGNNQIATIGYVDDSINSVIGTLSNTSLLDQLESRLRAYIDAGDNDVYTRAVAYTDQQIAALRAEFNAALSALETTLRSLINAIEVPSYHVGFNGPTVVSSKSSINMPWSYQPTHDGILVFRVRGHADCTLKIDGKEVLRGFNTEDDQARRWRMATLPVVNGHKYTIENYGGDDGDLGGPILFFKLYLARDN